MELKEVYNYCLEDKFSMDELEGRRLYINTDIDDSVIESAVYHILRYNREDKGIAAEDRKPIILYVNTDGGSVTSGYALVDAILASKTPVYTVNQGRCYSMGFLIFLAGHKRYAMEYSTFLMHDGNTMTWDSTAKAKDRMDFESGQVEVKTKKYILSHSCISGKYYDQKYRIEWYFYPEEAKVNGFCDYIIGVDCDIDEII